MSTANTSTSNASTTPAKKGRKPGDPSQKRSHMVPVAMNDAEHKLLTELTAKLADREVGRVGAPDVMRAALASYAKSIDIG